jgi:hypothetical protein
MIKKEKLNKTLIPNINQRDLSLEVQLRNDYSKQKEATNEFEIVND